MPKLTKYPKGFGPITSIESSVYPKLNREQKKYLALLHRATSYVLDSFTEKEMNEYERGQIATLCQKFKIDIKRILTLSASRGANNAKTN